MKIYKEILKHSIEDLSGKKPLQKLQLINTLSICWQQVSKHLINARVIDASALLPFFSKVVRYIHRYDRCVEFSNLSPFHHSVWIELADPQVPARFAALLLYATNNPELAAEARQYGITSPFNWRCQVRCFIKRSRAQTLPLRWEWVEFVDDRGLSAGSLLQPVSVSEPLGRATADDIKRMELIHHDLCAFIANLGLYAVDVINNNQISLTARTCQEVTKPGHDGMLNYYVITEKA